MGQLIVFHVFLLGLIICLVNGCTLEGYYEMGVMERFVQSEYVVYGRTVNHHAHKVNNKGESMYIIDAIFQVYCVMKRGEESVGEIITVVGIAPRDDCSGTLVHSLMRVGDHAIIALTNSTGGNFILDEIMPKTSAAVRAYKPYFFSLSKICDLQTWESPSGASVNRCPICGTADFEAEIQTLDNSYNQLAVCTSSQNAIVSNMTECDLYMEYTFDESNTRTCVPADFDQTCTKLLYRTGTATCDCNPKNKHATIGVGAGQTVLPSTFMTFLVLTTQLINM